MTGHDGSVVGATDPSKLVQLAAGATVGLTGEMHASKDLGLNIVKLDGERVMDLECVIGYLHRGIEKILESRPYLVGVVVPEAEWALSFARDKGLPADVCFLPKPVPFGQLEQLVRAALGRVR